MAMKMTVTNSQGFEFPAGEYILKLTKIDPPEEQEFDDRKSMRSTWYFTVVEVIDTEAEDDDEVMGKELRKYITIPENGMTPRSNLRQYTEALLGRKLEPGVGIIHGGGRSEFFRTKHGHDQVDEAAKGDEADNDIFHGRNGLWKW